MGNNKVMNQANLGKSGLVSLGSLAVSAATLKTLGASNEDIAREIIPGYEAAQEGDDCGAFGERAGAVAGIAGGVAGAAVSGPAALVTVPLASMAANLAVTPAATFLCTKTKNLFRP